MRFQTPVSEGNDYVEKGLLEKMFPTVYSLWKVIRKNRTPTSRPPDRHRPFPQRPAREVGQPTQAASVDQPTPAAPEAKVAPPTPAQPQQQAAKSVTEPPAAAAPTERPPAREPDTRPLQADGRVAQAPPSPTRQVRTALPRSRGSLQLPQRYSSQASLSRASNVSGSGPRPLIQRLSHCCSAVRPARPPHP